MPDVLVTTSWLHDHLHNPNLRIVDIRGHVLPASQPTPHYFNHYHDYVKSHILGAAFVDWVHAITDPTDPRHTQIAPPERYAALMRAIGVNDDTLVVAYDDAGGMFAARLWWSLLYYGHEQVAVLDGGWTKWTAENKPTETTLPTFPTGNFTPRPNPALRRTADEVAAGIATDQTLLDVRTPAEYRGEQSRASRAGHIPTAMNLPRGMLLNSDDTMPNAATIQAQFAQAGVNDDTANVVFYCNGGVSASYGLLAYRAAGFEGGAVYDGSWKDWGNDDTRPIEK